MIIAKEACVRSHQNRNKIMDTVKERIETNLQQNVARGEFNAVVFYGEELDVAQREELVDYLKDLGYDVEDANVERIKFSWLVD